MLIILRRSVFVCGLLLCMATVVFGAGSYQRTKDGKTTVWNSNPKEGDEAVWSGGRDREGYASGFGTLTWYTARREGRATPTIYARYFGNMVRGKLSGAVNAHSKGKTAHALFVEGERTTRWTSGPAPSWQTAPAPDAATTSPAAAAEPEAPAEQSAPTVQAKPAPSPVATPPAQTKETPENRPPVETPSAQKKKLDDSLQSLIAPPSSIRTPPAPPAAPPEAGPRLTQEEVNQLADAEMRIRGYDPDNYRRGEPEYSATDKTWSIAFEQRSSDGMEEPPKRFRVVIDDKTKGRVFLLAK